MHILQNENKHTQAPAMCISFNDEEFTTEHKYLEENDYHRTLYI